jgi:hypothetical protein
MMMLLLLMMMMMMMITVIMSYFYRYMSYVTYCVTDSTFCIQVNFFAWNVMYKYSKLRVRA